MAAITISEIRVIEWGNSKSAPTDETLAEGDAVRADVTDGQLTGANGTDSTQNRFLGLVVAIDAGQVATVAGNGCLVTLGTGLSAADYGVYVYLSDTDKKLTLTSGESTTTKIVGQVEAVRNQGTVYKAMRVLGASS